jgi:hypothetical protein
MRRIRAFAVAALVGATFFMSSAFAQSAPIEELPAHPGPPLHFYADLTDNEQTTPINSTGKGRAEFTLDRDTLRLSWKVTYTGLSDVTGVTINGPQRVGINGSAIYNVGEKGLTSPIEGSVIMSEGELQYLMERHLYVNVITAAHKTGELRGQIDRVPPKDTKKRASQKK